MAVIIISSAFLLAAAGCKKSNNSSSSGMSASVGSNSWSSGSSATEGIYVSSQGQFQIGGTQIKSGDTTAFVLNFVTPFTLGTAMNSDTAYVDINYIDSKTLNLYDGGSQVGWSILTVTSYNSTGHTIAGTFNGVLYNLSNSSDSLVISNGKFNSSYTLQ